VRRYPRLFFISYHIDGAKKDLGRRGFYTRQPKREMTRRYAQLDRKLRLTTQDLGGSP
jgi:hypothetical protein